MKLIAISIAALGLGSNVLAAPSVTSAPASTLPVVSELTGAVEGFPVVETVTGLVGSATELLKRSDISVITGAIATLNAAVTSNLTTLSKSSSEFDHILDVINSKLPSRGLSRQTSVPALSQRPNHSSRTSRWL
jgi:hypothetical protein